MFCFIIYLTYPPYECHKSLVTNPLFWMMIMLAYNNNNNNQYIIYTTRERTTEDDTQDMGNCKKLRQPKTGIPITISFIALAVVLPPQDVPTATTTYKHHPPSMLASNREKVNWLEKCLRCNESLLFLLLLMWWLLSGLNDP